MKVVHTSYTHLQAIITLIVSMANIPRVPVIRDILIHVWLCTAVNIHYVKSLQSLLMYLTEETKTFTMLGEVGRANEWTKTTQTSVQMAQHNEQTRLHDLLCTPTNLHTHALVMPTIVLSNRTLVCVVFVQVQLASKLAES